MPVIARHHLRRIAGVLLLQQLIDTARVLQRQIVGNVRRERRWRRRSAGRNPLCGSRDRHNSGLRLVQRGRLPCRCNRHRLASFVATLLVIPSGLVVGLGGIIEAREQPVLRQLETVFDEEGRICVVDQIFLRDTVVRESIADDAAQEGSIGAGADLKEKVGLRCRAGKAGIDTDQLRIAVALGLDRPLESARVVLGRIAAHDQHHVGVLDVDPAVGHRPAPESWSQT